MYLFRKKQKSTAEKAQAVCTEILQLEASKNQLATDAGAAKVKTSIFNWKKRPNIKIIDKKIKIRIEKLKRLVHKEVDSNRLALSNKFPAYSHEGLQYECLKQLLNSDIGQTNAIAKLASDFFQDFENTPFLVHARACELLKNLEQLKTLTRQFVKNAAAQQEAEDLKEALSKWGFHRNRKYPYGGKHYIPMQQATENITLALDLYQEYVAGSVLTRNRVINGLAAYLSLVSDALYEHIQQCVDLKDVSVIQQIYQDMVICRKLLQQSQLDTVNPILKNKPNIQGETNKKLKPDPTTNENNRKLKRY